MRLGVQTSGEKYWENEYNKPQYDFQPKIVNFGEPNFIGTPIVVSGFFTAPFIKKNKLTFGYDVGLGAAFNWKPFNPINNNQNLSIGARQSFYFDLELILGYNILYRLSMEAGLNLSHYSNGSLKLPNLGINIIAPKFSMYYKFKAEKKKSKIERKSYKGIEYNFSVFRY